MSQTQKDSRSPTTVRPLSGGRPEGAEPARVLRWAVSEIAPGRAVLSTSFGIGGIVLIHHLHDLGLRPPVIFIDTLHHFPETLALAERVRDRYQLDLRIERPAPDLEAFERAHGPRLWERDVEQFHRVTKVVPMARALDGVEVWITARRRDQSARRSRLPVVERGRFLKVNPLAGWTREDVWAFIRSHDLPYNPLHDRGYTSIGDRPLTTPVRPGESERAGRWRGSDRTECGIHLL